METRTKIFIGVGVAVIIVGAVVYFKVIKKKLIIQLSKEDSWNKLKENIGAQGTIQTGGDLRVNSADKKRYAQLYSNGRIIIFSNDGKRIGSGSYINGGTQFDFDNKQVSSFGAADDQVYRAIQEHLNKF